MEFTSALMLSGDTSIGSAANTGEISSEAQQKRTKIFQINFSFFFPPCHAFYHINGKTPNLASYLLTNFIISFFQQTVNVLTNYWGNKSQTPFYPGLRKNKKALLQNGISKKAGQTKRSREPLKRAVPVNVSMLDFSVQA